MALKGRDAAPGLPHGNGPALRRPWRWAILLLPAGGIAALAFVAWQHGGHRWATGGPPGEVIAPDDPVAVARETLPRALVRVRAEPGSVDARLELVACHRLLGDRLGAWQQLALAEALGGPIDAIRTARVRTAESLGQWEDAVATAERAWRESPSDLRRALEVHRLCTLRGAFEGAFAAVKVAAAHHPADPAALQALGEACFNLARYPEAIRHLEAALALAGDRPPPVPPAGTRGSRVDGTAARVQLGVALLRSDRGREAVERLREVVTGPEPPAQAWEFLGQALLSTGQVEDAKMSFQRAEEAGAPGGGAAFGVALAALGHRWATGGPPVAEEAEAALHRALARDPQHGPAAETLAQLLRSRKRSAEAAAVRGRAALAVGDAPAAVAAFHEALRPGTALSTAARVSTLRALARALQAADDAPAALAALRRAAELAPADDDLRRQQVETALAAFAPQEALRACRRSPVEGGNLTLRFARVPASAPHRSPESRRPNQQLRTNNEQPRAQRATEGSRSTPSAEDYWRQFRAYRQLQDGPRALAALQAAAAARPDHPVFLTWQARVLLEEAPRKPELDRAETLLRRALRRQPSHADALTSLAEIGVRRRRWEEAGAFLRRALALDAGSGSSRLWLQLAQVDRAAGRPRDAAWAVARYRQSEARRTELARRRAEAASAARDAARIRAWATAALNADQSEEARSAARLLIRLSPRDPSGYRLLATACQRLGRLEDRIVAMEAASGMKADGRPPGEGVKR